MVAQDTFLPIDTSYLEESDNTVDSYDNYTDLTGSLGNDLISEFTKYRNDKNLNIDYTKYDNHTFFGSARRKLVNFKNINGFICDHPSSVCFELVIHDSTFLMNVII